MPRPPWFLVAALVVVGVLAAGCGDDDGSGDDDTLATTTTVSAGDGAPATTSAADGVAPATTSTVDGEGGGDPACPDDDPLVGAVSVSEVALDIDGDGIDDEVRAAEVDGDWVLAATLSTGGVAVGPVGATGGPVDVRPLGGVPIDDEPGSEVVVQAGAGAATILVGVHRLDGCALVPLRLGADEARFPVGATVTRTDGVSCPPDGGLVHRSGESLDGITYDVVAVTYRIDGDDLVEVSRQTTAVGPDDPAFGDLARLDCGTARLG